MQYVCVSMYVCIFDICMLKGCLIIVFGFSRLQCGNYELRFNNCFTSYWICVYGCMDWVGIFVINGIEEKLKYIYVQKN